MVLLALLDIELDLAHALLVRVKLEGQHLVPHFLLL